MRVVPDADTAKKIAAIIMGCGYTSMTEDYIDHDLIEWRFEDSQDRVAYVYSDGGIGMDSHNSHENTAIPDPFIFDAWEIIRLMFPKKDKGRWISAAIMEMLAQGEYRLSDISSRLQINAYQQVRYLWLKGRIGRRNEKVAAKNAAYATPEWYKSKGITDYLMHEDGREHTQTP